MKEFFIIVKEAWQEEPLLFTFFTLCLLGAIVLVAIKPSRWPFLVGGFIIGYLISRGKMTKFKRLSIDMNLCVTAVRTAWAATYREVGPPTHLFVPPELKPIDPTILYYIEKEFGLEIEIQTDLEKSEWCVGYYDQNTGDKVYTWGSNGEY